MKKKERNYSSKDVVRDIISMHRFLPKYLELGKDYNDLLKYLLSVDFYDDDIPYPSIKEMQAKLMISYSVLRRKLFQLYDDLSEHDYLGIDFSVNKVEYVFILEYFDNQEYITINDLPVVPRVGEQVRIPFFQAKVGTSNFYVRSVDHYIEDRKQSIHIKLGSGTYNLYWHLKKDEEFDRGHLSWHEYYSTVDYKLKERYGLRG